MKPLLLLAIRIYWRAIPKANRRKCLFRVNCSQFVYTETSRDGFRAGVKALRFRFRNCRNGFHLFHHPADGSLQMILPGGGLLPEREIAERLINQDSQ